MYFICSGGTLKGLHFVGNRSREMNRPNWVYVKCENFHLCGGLRLCYFELGLIVQGY